MPKLDESWPGQLRVVGDLERPDHYHLTPDDECAFFGDYTPRAGFAHSATNQLIANLKKKPSTRGSAQWPHKLRAIREVAEAIRSNLLQDRLPHLTFVPIPPSKLRNDPEYDDRMTSVARLIFNGADVRELIYATAARDAAHEADDRRDLDALRQSLAVNHAALAPAPTTIVLLDDMLTTGRSFRVCNAMLQEVLPGVPLFGLFVARRVPAPFLGFDNLDALI